MKRFKMIAIFGAVLAMVSCNSTPPPVYELCIHRTRSQHAAALDSKRFDRVEVWTIKYVGKGPAMGVDGKLYPFHRVVMVEEVGKRYFLSQDTNNVSHLEPAEPGTFIIMEKVTYQLRMRSMFGVLGKRRPRIGKDPRNEDSDQSAVDNPICYQPITPNR